MRYLVSQIAVSRARAERESRPEDRDLAFQFSDSSQIAMYVQCTTMVYYINFNILAAL